MVSVDEAAAVGLQQDQQQMTHQHLKIVAQCIKNTKNVHFTVLALQTALGGILSTNHWMKIEIARMTLIY